MVWKDERESKQRREKKGAEIIERNILTILGNIWGFKALK